MVKNIIRITRKREDKTKVYVLSVDVGCNDEDDEIFLSELSSKSASIYETFTKLDSEPLYALIDEIATAAFEFGLLKGVR